MTPEIRRDTADSHVLFSALSRTWMHKPFVVRWHHLLVARWLIKLDLWRGCPQ